MIRSLASTTASVTASHYAEIRSPNSLQWLLAIGLQTGLCSSESWTFTKAQLQKLEVFQMRCLRTTTGLSLRDRKTNDYIRKLCSNQPAIGTIVRRNRMRWAGHMWRMNNNWWPKITVGAPVSKTRKVHKNAPRKIWLKLIVEDHFSVRDGCTKPQTVGGNGTGCVRLYSEGIGNAVPTWLISSFSMWSRHSSLMAFEAEVNGLFSRRIRDALSLVLLSILVCTTICVHMFTSARK